MTKYGITNMHQQPQDFPSTCSKKMKEAWIHKVATEVVHFCEQPFPAEGVEVMAKGLKDPTRLLEEEPHGEEDPMGYCTCGEGRVIGL